MKKETKRIAVGTVLAAGIGYVTGILTAPKSGKETRKDIQDKAIQAKRESEKRLKALHSDLDRLITKAKKSVGDIKVTGQKDLEKAIALAVAAKDKAREVLSAVHEGGSDDKDLQNAIKDADNAIDHLKKFLSKSS